MSIGAICNRTVISAGRQTTVVEVLAEEVPAESVTIGDIMTTDILPVHEEDGVWQTIEQMADRGVRRSPVVDALGRLVGLITVDDLIDLLAEEMRGLGAIIDREKRRERRLRRTA
jgi:CBS domain-containing protein